MKYFNKARSKSKLCDDLLGLEKEKVATRLVFALHILILGIPVKSCGYYNFQQGKRCGYYVRVATMLLCLKTVVGLWHLSQSLVQLPAS